MSDEEIKLALNDAQTAIAHAGNDVESIGTSGSRTMLLFSIARNVQVIAEVLVRDRLTETSGEV